MALDLTVTGEFNEEDRQHGAGRNAGRPVMAGYFHSGAELYAEVRRVLARLVGRLRPRRPPHGGRRAGYWRR
ncbi:hypothetical protein [Streptomyces chrestomyceticus]|uniref:hypothetical protein n=1 Tax=Streptomyces chrestomyceticus TaxID=68185 RepID=UPI0033C064B2